MAKHRRHKRTHKNAYLGLIGNPAGVLAQSLRPITKPMEWIPTSVGVLAGFVIPQILMERVPANWKNSLPKFFISKLVIIGLQGAVAGKVLPKFQKAIVIGGGLSIIYDAYKMWVEPTILNLVARKTTSTTTITQYLGEEEIGNFGEEELGEDEEY